MGVQIGRRRATSGDAPQLALGGQPPSASPSVDSGQHRLRIGGYYLGMSFQRLRPLFLIAGGLLTGCQMTPTAPPEPDLQLLQAAPLELPPTCSASGSFYVAFTVDGAGRTGDIRVSDAPPCIQEALTAWVESFRYQPPGRPVPAAIEWLMVAAPRGT